MALFASQNMTQASGSVGGVTYSRSASGMYMRARAMPVNPATALMGQTQSAFTAAVNRWTETLSPAERASWDLYAANVTRTNRLGATFNASGQNWFVGSQSVAGTLTAKLGIAMNDLTDGPAIFNRGDFTTPEEPVATTAAGVVVTLDSLDDWASDDGSYMLLFQGKPSNVTRNYFRGPWRLVGAQAGNNITPPADIVANQATLTTLGWPLVIGQKVHWAVEVLRTDGRLSTRRKLNPTIIAT